MCVEVTLLDKKQLGCLPFTSLLYTYCGSFLFDCSTIIENEDMIAGKPHVKQLSNSPHMHSNIYHDIDYNDSMIPEHFYLILLPFYNLCS